MSNTLTDREQIIAHMNAHNIARAKDLRALGVSATAISRATRDGLMNRISRGLYQRPDAEIETYSQLAEVSKRYPQLTICLLSALSFYGVTDQIPRKIWGAIKAKGWAPKDGYPKIRSVRFREPYYSWCVIHHNIAGINVPIYSLEKTLADAFRNPKLVDRSVAIEALRATLTEKKSTPSKIADVAKKYGAWNQMAPYLEALTANG